MEVVYWGKCTPLRESTTYYVSGGDLEESTLHTSPRQSSSALYQQFSCCLLFFPAASWDFAVKSTVTEKCMKVIKVLGNSGTVLYENTLITRKEYSKQY